METHKKDFTEWHGRKTRLHNEKVRPFFHEREVWSCHLGENVGFEQDGRGISFLRPVIILKKFNNEILWAVPLTRTERRNVYYFAFSLEERKTSVAILSQIRLVDAKRLKYKIGDVKASDFKLLKSKIRQLLA